MREAKVVLDKMSPQDAIDYLDTLYRINRSPVRYYHVGNDDPVDCDSTSVEKPELEAAIQGIAQERNDSIANDKYK